MSASFVCLSPLSSVRWGSLVRVSSLGWCASSRSVLVFVVGSPVPLTCRVGSSPSEAVSSLVALLRAARDSGGFVRFATRLGWSASEWFCGVSFASEIDISVLRAKQADARAARRAAEIASLESALACLSEVRDEVAAEPVEDAPELEDWEYYGPW